MKCTRCKATAVVALPSHNAAFCPECFLDFFSKQVDKGIREHGLMTKQDRVLVALSGGKDSLALMLELGRQGYDVTGLHVDLGIPESSPAARGVVERFCEKYGFPLIVRDMVKEGLPIPEVKAKLRRPICSACGKIKRYFFNQTAREQ
ncbi:MAG: tRNA(Ile)-lysidine synthetase, partial [Mailhella sp.]|nr:tRNA(Ile)-lysidine synthetase [Mailhella sp.]